MSTFTKILLVPALVVAFSVGVAIAASGGGGDSSPLAQVAPSTSGLETTTAETTTTETTTGIDVSGPCDEAEHANDPRCTGVGDDRLGDDGREAGEDAGGGGHEEPVGRAGRELREGGHECAVQRAQRREHEPRAFLAARHMSP